MLVEYNETSSQLSREQSPLQLQEILAINSELWQSSLQPECTTSESRSVPWHTKREVIQAFLLRKRCEEELQLLEDAMRNVLEYWSSRITVITDEIEQLQENICGNQFNIGAINSLKHLLWESELQLSKAVALFRNSKTIIVDHIVSMDIEADPSDQSDLDSDSSTSSESEDE